MNAYTQKTELDATSLNMFLQLFHERILALESLSSNGLYLSKQKQIRGLRNKIESFIKEHSYSYFRVVILNEEDDLDLDKPSSGIIVRNFQYFMKDYTPREYYITILPTWTEARFFQLSPRGLRIEETII